MSKLLNLAGVLGRQLGAEIAASCVRWRPAYERSHRHFTEMRAEHRAPSRVGSVGTRQRSRNVKSGSRAPSEGPRVWIKPQGGLAPARRTFFAPWMSRKTVHFHLSREDEASAAANERDATA